MGWGDANRRAGENGTGQGGLARIVVFAECGLLAGDLAAMLSGRYKVTRATSIPGARQALAEKPDALIIVEGQSLVGNPTAMDLVELGLGSGCRILLLGAPSDSIPSRWTEKIVRLKSLPEPLELFEALGDLPLKEAEFDG